MYQQNDYSVLLGMPGFSDDLLNAHFGLYAGYVKNTNTLIEMLDGMEKGTPTYNELNRRFGWEFNGMRLHELYFGNMTKEAVAQDDTREVHQAIVEAFGSFDAWKEDFVATASMRGIGWVILTKDPHTGKLFNVWINEHDVGHLSGGMPLLVLDVFEHAYVLDYGMNRADYINAFFGVINWDEVNTRFTA